MSTIPITFIKCFYKENITENLEQNNRFKKENILKDDTDVYSFSMSEDLDKFSLKENKKVYATLNAIKIYVHKRSYIFSACTYDVDIGDNNFEQEKNIGNTSYRIAHNVENLDFPDQEIIEEFFKNLKYFETLSFFYPNGASINRQDYRSHEFESYRNFLNEKENDKKSRTYSFVFIDYQKITNLDKCSFDFTQNLQKATFGNAFNYPKTSYLEPVTINNDYLIYAAKSGVTLIKQETEFESINSLRCFYKYLDALKIIIHFEIKAKEFNYEIDKGEYKNIDELNKLVRKEMRNAVHEKYEIKNSIKMNDSEKIFYGQYLTAINFDETLSEFIEICRSIEKELRAKIDEREEQHDRHFDKILSVVAIFAIVSVFKDGSDLLLSMVDAITTRVFNVSDIISIAAPALCAVSIFVLLKLFKRK